MASPSLPPCQGIDTPSPLPPAFCTCRRDAACPVSTGGREEGARRPAPGGGLLTRPTRRRRAGTPLAKHTFLFYGAGEAGAGIADLIAEAIAAEAGGAVSLRDARARIFMMDSKGLVTSARTGLAHHKLNYAHDAAPCGTLLECIDALKPSALIGVAAVAKAFTKEVVEAMAALNDAPLIFALSNPTSKAECLAAEAYEWSGGRAVFASGSPMEGATVGGRRLEPGCRRRPALPRARRLLAPAPAALPRCPARAEPRGAGAGPPPPPPLVLSGHAASLTPY